MIVLEIVAGYLGAYFGRKALDLAFRAGSDVDAAFDRKLTQLYDWVKGKLTGRPSGEMSLSLLKEDPDGETQQALVTDQLSQAVGGDEAAMQELRALLGELDRLRPPGVRIRGLATADDLYGDQIGLVAQGPLPEGSSAEGEARAATVHPGARNVGTDYKATPPVPDKNGQ